MTEKKKTAARIPSAKKRARQNEERRLRNRSYKSTVGTTVRKYREAVGAGQSEEAKTLLSSIYSLMDKGLKRGIFKRGKVDRVKSRLAA